MGPTVAAVVLIAVTLPALDGGHAMMVLRGVGLLLACGWAASTDDSCSEVLAASPYPHWQRFAARALAGLVVVLPVWVAAAVAVELQAPAVPVLGTGLEAVSLGVAGLAMGAAMTQWGNHPTPSYAATAAVLVLALLAAALPSELAMMPSETSGSSWEAAQVRWNAVLLLACGILALAVRDPLQSGAADRWSPDRRWRHG